MISTITLEYGAKTCASEPNKLVASLTYTLKVGGYRYAKNAVKKCPQHPKG